jgi:hypothetical protein
MEAMVDMITLDMVDMETMVIIQFWVLIWFVGYCGFLL